MRKLLTTLALVLSMVGLSRPAFADATMVSQAIWSDGKLYGTVVTPADLPDRGPFDLIYSFGSSGLSGPRSISDAHPGEPGFNGGRWEVHLVAFTPSGKAALDHNGDGAIDSELTSYDQLKMYESAGYLTIGTDAFRRFVCTMLPNG